MKGLLVTIYKSEYDCTNGGLSSKATKAIAVHDLLPEIFESDDIIPAFQLVKRELSHCDYWTAYPIIDGVMKQGMFGGNFLYCSDSRFNSLNRYPIAIHDRFE
jgi:hypothetical protein